MQLERPKMTATTVFPASIPQRERYLREREVLQILPVSRYLWLTGIKAGNYPAGIKLSPRVTVWRASDIDALMARLATA